MQEVKMNFQFYLEKLQDSKEFKDFIKENPEAFLCSGFFTIDNQSKEQHHLDFYIPDKKEMFSFNLDNGIEKMKIEEVETTETKSPSPEKIPNNCDFNFENVEKLIANEMFLKKIRNKIQKIFISLQAKNSKCYLICTVFISAFGLLRVDISLPEMKIIEFEKKNFFDIMKVSRKKKD
jgi:hypothetical protein